ncbi:MAG: DUF2269 family protein, partial [Candidatus Thiodiazotropha sp.]
TLGFCTSAASRRTRTALNFGDTGLLVDNLDCHGTHRLYVVRFDLVCILIPVQIRQARLVLTFEPDNPIPDQYWHLNRIWYGFGILAILLPLGNIYWMAFKPN